MRHGAGDVRLCTAVLTILGIHSALLAYAATRHSPTFDEAAYLPAGIRHWRFGRFDLYRSCPPLVRIVAALPVLGTGVRTDWEHIAASGVMNEFVIGRHFARVNGVDTFRYMTLARWACIPFSLLGAYLCFRWARELYGAPAGLLALVLWCFSPAILGHGALITSDVATASLSVLAFYLLRYWLKAPSWSRAAALGTVLGLLLLTRTNAVLLFAFWPALWLGTWLLPPRPPGGRRPAVEAAQLLLAGLIGLEILNAGYLADGSLVRLGDYQFVSRALAGAEGGANRFAKTWLGEVPVPLPMDYVLGADELKRNFESNGKLAYLRGEFRKTGWWYYYLYGLAVKVPLGTWLLFLLAATVGWRYRAGAFDEAVLLVPAASYLAFLSTQRGLNAHVRYVLPIAPFLFIWISKLARAVERRHPLTTAAGAAALVWTIGASLAMYPHNLSYFNEAAGGPLRGHDHLLDSNIDWGQDLIRLKEWLARNPAARPIRIAYFGSYSPADVGIPFELPPMVPPLEQDELLSPHEQGPQPGWYAISVNFLRGYRFFVIGPDGVWVRLTEPHLTYFQHLRPAGRAGFSIYLYHLTLDDANRLRKELGFPPLV